MVLLHSAYLLCCLSAFRRSLWGRHHRNSGRYQCSWLMVLTLAHLHTPASPRTESACARACVWRGCECLGSSLLSFPVGGGVCLGVAAVGCCTGVVSLSPNAAPEPGQPGLGWGAPAALPQILRGHAFAPAPIHQPQLAKVGGAIMALDLRFTGKSCSVSMSPCGCVCVIRLWSSRPVRITWGPKHLFG